MILQTLRWRLWFVATDPAMHPATRSLDLPGDLTFVPALQVQGNGLLTNFELGLHPYTSWFPHQKV